MVYNKRKKFSRQRGSHTHGGGSKKKRRGAGNRGGRGKAGSGKRGDAKKPSYWKNKNYYGKAKGFISRKKALKTINIKELELFSESNINLKKHGYDKLLGTGKPTKKYNLVIDYASKKAIEKIKKTGGEVSGLKEKKIKKKKQNKREVEEEAETTQEEVEVEGEDKEQPEQPETSEPEKEN